MEIYDRIKHSFDSLVGDQRLIMCESMRNAFMGVGCEVTDVTDVSIYYKGYLGRQRITKLDIELGRSGFVYILGRGGLNLSNLTIAL